MSSKYVIGLRHRPNPNDDIGIRHKRFISRQLEIPKVWAIPDAEIIDLPEISGELVSVIDLDYLTDEEPKKDMHLKNPVFTRPLAFS